MLGTPPGFLQGDKDHMTGDGQSCCRTSHTAAKIGTNPFKCTTDHDLRCNYSSVYRWKDARQGSLSALIISVQHFSQYFSLVHSNSPHTYTTRDRSIPRSLQIGVLTKSSISQATFFSTHISDTSGPHFRTQIFWDGDKSLIHIRCARSISSFPCGVRITRLCTHPCRVGCKHNTIRLQHSLSQRQKIQGPKKKICTGSSSVRWVQPFPPKLLTRITTPTPPPTQSEHHQQHQQQNQRQKQEIHGSQTGQRLSKRNH